MRGFGDYRVKSNSLKFGGMSPPMIVNSVQNGGIIVRHREYIADISTSVAFLNRNLPINPGMVTTFPWLAQVANAFEQYRFRGLAFEFKSLSADALVSGSTSVGQGSVIMATQYNSLSPGFSTKIEMENYEYANSCKPSCSFMHPVECDLRQTPNTPLYIRSGAIPADADERLYDMGNFNLATVGIPTGTDNNVCGELWATFEIEFFKPKYNPDSAEGLGLDKFQSSWDQATEPNGNVKLTPVAAMGVLTSGYFAGNIGCALQYNVANTLDIVFPPNTTEVDEVFLVSYTAKLNAAFIYPTAGLAALGVNMTGVFHLNPNNPLDSLTTVGGGRSFQKSNEGNIVGTTTGTEILYIAYVKALALPVAGGDRIIRISGFENYLPAEGIVGKANVVVVKLPRVTTFVPMHLSNLTEFGTDV